jgi:signal peptidase I
MLKILNRLGLLLLGVVMIFTIFVYVAPHFGWNVDEVISGSMSPTIPVGSLVIYTPMKTGRVIIGDIIVFKIDPDANMICHRAVGFNASELTYTTKGDANDSVDPFVVPAANVKGIITFHMPKIGYLIKFLHTLPGFLVGIILPAATIVWKCASSIKDEIEEKLASPESVKQ